jgi:ferric-dicitrate binding protein FerR (iron transport regulator)
MKKLFSILATGLLLSTAAVAVAATDDSTGTGTSSAASGTMQQKNVQLKNGTQIEIDADSSVHAVKTDGSKAEVADGTYTLSDGSSLTVKNGKKSS